MTCIDLVFVAVIISMILSIVYFFVICSVTDNFEDFSHLERGHWWFLNFVGGPIIWIGAIIIYIIETIALTYMYLCHKEVSRVAKAFWKFLGEI